MQPTPTVGSKRPRADEPIRCRFLRICDLPASTTAAALTDLLAPHGTVEEARMGSGMAWLAVRNTREAVACKQRLEQSTILYPGITVTFDPIRAPIGVR